MAIDENTPTIEVVKSPSGKPIASGAAPESAEGAMISNVNEEGFVQADDVTATREVVSPTTLPLSYEYDEKQMMANVSTAISADIEDMTERELLEDETFGFASKKMFRAFRGEDFTGTDEEATQFGIDLMRRVENNLVELGDFSYQVQDMSGDDAQIALYMMDMFEAKEFTGRGFGEALGYMGLDPTTYIGLGTFGFGFAGKEAAKAATKQGMRAVLQKMAYSGATVGAVEGAVYTGAFEHGKQVVSEAAGEGYDSGSVGLNVAIGAGVGAAAGKYLPEIFDYAAGKVTKWSAAKNFKAEVRAAADAGDADAIKVLADMELLDNHFDSDGFMRRKLDELEQTRVGQAITGAQRIVPESKIVKKQIEDVMDKTTRDENFKRWFDESKVIDLNEEPKVVYHGTTHDFGEFTMDRSNPENHHGTGFYFSDSVNDVNRNYGTEQGADLTQRIELAAERMTDDIMEERGIDDWDEAMEIAKEEAKKEFFGESPNVMPVYLKLDKPAVVGGDNQEFLEVRFFDEDGEFLDEPEGEGAELLEALVNSIESNTYDGYKVSREIVGELQEQFEDSFTLKEFEEALRSNENFMHLENDEGMLINHEIIGDAYSNAGYDGIILHNAEEQFKNMGMDEDTTHYVVFEPKNIKSVNNSGAFSDDGDILNSALIVPTVGAAAAATQTEGEDDAK